MLAHVHPTLYQQECESCRQTPFKANGGLWGKVKGKRHGQVGGEIIELRIFREVVERK